MFILYILHCIVLPRQATGYPNQRIWCLPQARINWEGCARKGTSVKMVGMAEMGAPISVDEVAVHPDCWCVCLCYLHFAPENPEDGKMHLLLPAHLGCPRHSPESCKMVVCVSCLVLPHFTLTEYTHTEERYNHGAQSRRMGGGNSTVSAISDRTDENNEVRRDKMTQCKICDLKTAYYIQPS